MKSVTVKESYSYRWQHGESKSNSVNAEEKLNVKKEFLECVGFSALFVTTLFIACLAIYVLR